MRDMIILLHQKPFAKGSRRQCYVHQEDADKCIKVTLPERSPEAIRKSSKLYKRILGASHFDENINEIKGHQSLFVYEHFPVCFDIIDTDLGKGLVVELIRNDDGNIASTVSEVMQERQLTSEELQALKVFVDYLMKHGIIVRDLTPRNVVFQYKDGRVKAYMIDGFGNSDFLPFVKFSVRLARAKILRKVSRTFQFLNYRWQPELQ